MILMILNMVVLADGKPVLTHLTQFQTVKPFLHANKKIPQVSQ